MSNPKTEQELWEQALREAWEAYDAYDAYEMALLEAEEADNTDDHYSEWEDPGIPKY